MAQSSKNIWTRRFQILLSLVLAISIMLIVIVYISSGHSYAVTELALTGFLLLCGVGILSVLRSPLPRHIVLGAGFFVLIALLILLASLGSQGRIGRQPTLSFRQILSSWVLVIALLAFAGKMVTRIVAWTERTLSQPTSWFLPLSLYWLLRSSVPEERIQNKKTTRRTEGALAPSVCLSRWASWG